MVKSLIENKNFKRNRILLIVLPLILVCVILIWNVRPTSSDAVRFETKNGVWDVTAVDFSKDYVLLQGEVEYVAEELLTPEEFDQNEDIKIGYPQHDVRYSTSRVRIYAPQGQYILASTSIDFSDIIYINGIETVRIGQPGSDKESTITDTEYYYIPVSPDENGVIEIVQQASNFAHRESGGHTNLNLGKSDIMFDLLVRMVWPETTFMGCYLLLFLIHLILFFMQRSYTQNLLFSLFCLTWFFRTGVVGTRVLRITMPALSWEAAFRIEYLTLPISCVLLVWILHKIFPGVMQKWFPPAVSAVCAVFGCIYLFADTLFMSNTLIPLEIIFGIASVYIIVRGVMKVRNINTEQLVILIGFGFFLFAFLWDALYYNDIYIISPIHFPISEIVMIVFVLFSMTAMLFGTVREALETREHAQKIAAEKETMERMHEMKQELMANLTHEMRTPLTVMSTYAQLAVKELKKEDFDRQTTEDLDTISKEAQRLAEMASAVLDVFRDQKAPQDDVSAISIGEVIGQTTRLYTPIATRQGNKLYAEIPDDLPKARGSVDGFTQVVWNLLENANRYTHEGEICIAAKADRQKIFVAVEDNGEGIAPELLPRIFERHEKGDKGETGLGLAICDRIMRECGGKIEIESKKGAGTVVTLTLRVRDENGQ